MSGLCWSAWEKLPICSRGNDNVTYLEGLEVFNDLINVLWEETLSRVSHKNKGKKKKTMQITAFETKQCMLIKSAENKELYLSLLNLRYLTWGTWNLQNRELELSNTNTILTNWIYSGLVSIILMSSMTLLARFFQ